MTHHMDGRNDSPRRDFERVIEAADRVVADRLYVAVQTVGRGLLAYRQGIPFEYMTVGGAVGGPFLYHFHIGGLPWPVLLKTSFPGEDAEELWEEWDDSETPSIMLVELAGPEACHMCSGRRFGMDMPPGQVAYRIAETQAARRVREGFTVSELRVSASRRDGPGTAPRNLRSRFRRTRAEILREGRTKVRSLLTLEWENVLESALALSRLGTLTYAQFEAQLRS